jgi:hypothetical protein
MSDYEKRLMSKVRELTEGAYPEFNIWPTRQLVMDAWGQGYDIVRIKPLASLPTPTGQLRGGPEDYTANPASGTHEDRR